MLEIDIPHRLRCGGEVVRALLGDAVLGGRTVVFGTAYFDREDRCALRESAREGIASPERRVGAERAAMRQVDEKTDVIGQRDTGARPAGVVQQAGENRSGGEAVKASGAQVD